MQTNTLGAENVMKAALAFDVSKVIVLSTDKAVYPVNAMGMSKALMEKCMVAKARMYGDSSTVFCGTRYGNVMASRGSVIPLFLKQIQAGEPLTVTDPNMTRFMMTIEGAVDLVLYAFAHGVPGDIFVQKAPSATIGTLAKALLKLLDAENEIRIIGTRHGEKLYETLLNREEMAQAEDLGDYYRVPADARDLNYSQFFQQRENRGFRSHRLQLSQRGTAGRGRDDEAAAETAVCAGCPERQGGASVTRILITGGRGFLGRNLAAHLRRTQGLRDLTIIDREDSVENLKRRLLRADVIFHLAGVNRPQDPVDFETGNAELTEQMCRFLREGRVLRRSSSVPRSRPNWTIPTGASKAKAENCAAPICCGYRSLLSGSTA